MIQLRILAGKKAGVVWGTRRFPVRIGRAAASDLQLEDQGVWDEHFRIGLNPAAGFVLETQPDALVTANNQPVQRAVLRNGDVIGIGSVKIQFWLGEARQRGLALQEGVVWAIIGVITALQIALVYWLIQ
jgi:hypothetical protein